MNIKKTTLCISAFIVVSILITYVGFFILNSSVQELGGVQKQRNALLLLGEELRQSSRDLTSFVRMYSVTGEQTYEDAYNNILDRRSGKKPRLATRRIAPNENKALLDLIREYGVTDEEMFHISEGSRLSNNLVPLEVEAMYLVKGLYKDASGNFTVKGPSDTAGAAKLVFSEEYVQYTKKIMAELDIFVKMLDERTEQLVSAQENSVARARLLMLGCLAGILAAVLFFASYVLRMVVMPLCATRDFAIRVADGDLSSVIDESAANELGQLRTTLNTMVRNLKTRMEDIETALRQAAAKEQEARAASDAAAAAGQEAQEKTAHMLQIACELENVARAVNTAADVLSTQVHTSAHNAREQADRVANTATAMEEMNAAVLNVAQSAGTAAERSTEARAKAEQGAQVVKKTVTSIGLVHEHSLTLKGDMATLAQHAQNINQIMGVISDIADQTNLLALNAAIEAARAGDAGRGFAVVADEVRKLAEKTMASTSDVAKAIQAIQASTDKSAKQVEVTTKDIAEATRFAEESGKVLAEIVSLAESSADLVRSIATASEEESATTEEISRSTAAVNAMAEQTTHAMEEASQAVEGLGEQTRVLNGLINELK